MVFNSFITLATIQEMTVHQPSKEVGYLGDGEMTQ